VDLVWLVGYSVCAAALIALPYNYIVALTCRRESAATLPPAGVD
jgi:hypothetical protein